MEVFLETTFFKKLEWRKDVQRGNNRNPAEGETQKETFASAALFWKRLRGDLQSSSSSFADLDAANNEKQTCILHTDWT